MTGETGGGPETEGERGLRNVKGSSVQLNSLVESAWELGERSYL